MKNIGTNTIETDRLILRRLVLDDAYLMYNNWCSDPLVALYVTWDVHENIDVTKKLLDIWVPNYKNDNFYLWGVYAKEDKTLIGSIDIRIVDNNDFGEIGYCYGKKWWGKGLGTEALKAVLDYGFNNIGLYMLTAKHLAENPASGKVMQKCGMKYDATIRSGYISKVTGIRDNLVYYSITKDEYDII